MRIRMVNFRHERERANCREGEGLVLSKLHSVTLFSNKTILPKPPQTAQPTRDQVFRSPRPWEHFSFKPPHLQSLAYWEAPIYPTPQRSMEQLPGVRQVLKEKIGYLRGNDEVKGGSFPD